MAHPGHFAQTVIGLAAAGMGWSLASPLLHAVVASAQDQVPLATVDPSAVVTAVDTVGSAGPWAVVLYVAYQIGRTVQGWEPTVRHDVGPEVLDLLKRAVKALEDKSPPSAPP